MPDSLLRIACFTLGLLLPALAQQTVVLNSTDPDIIYSPPLCTSASSTIANCTSPWQISNDTVPGSTVVYTDGPILPAGNDTPQVFLNFRASALYLRTSSSSNATVNFTLTAEPTDVTITTQLNTSVSLIIAIDIPATQTTTLGITYIHGVLPARFDIESITLTVPDASATSSFLPAPSLPLSSSPLIIVSPSSVSSTTNSGASTKATIVGTVLGVTLGAVFL